MSYFNALLHKWIEKNNYQDTIYQEINFKKMHEKYEYADWWTSESAQRYRIGDRI